MTPTLDFSVLGADIHSHLIPEIDDGAKNIETSIRLIKGLYELGFRRFTATPHVMADLYPNNPETINKGLRKVEAALAAEQLDVKFSAAAEYLMDEQFENLLETQDLLPIAGNHILVEMSFISAPPNLYHLLFRLQTKGYQPILAHPERYLFLKDNFDQYERLRERGCLLQVNILSLIGYYGKPIRDTALKLLKNKWVDFLGTDLHHDQQLIGLRKALQDRTVQRILAAYEFRNGDLELDL